MSVGGPGPVYGRCSAGKQWWGAGPQWRGGCGHGRRVPRRGVSAGCCPSCAEQGRRRREGITKMKSPTAIEVRKPRPSMPPSWLGPRRPRQHADRVAGPEATPVDLAWRRGVPQESAPLFLVVARVPAATIKPRNARSGPRMRWCRRRVPSGRQAWVHRTKRPGQPGPVRWARPSRSGLQARLRSRSPAVSSQLMRTCRLARCKTAFSEIRLVDTDLGG